MFREKIEGAIIRFQEEGGLPLKIHVFVILPPTLALIDAHRAFIEELEPSELKAETIVGKPIPCSIYDLDATVHLMHQSETLGGIIANSSRKYRTCLIVDFRE